MTVTCFVLPSLTDGVVLRMSAQSNTQPKGMTMHEITSTDNMFSVREMPWHGLGKVLSEYPTREEAKSIAHPWEPRSEEHTSELQSLMRISYAVFCLKKKNN